MFPRTGFVLFFLLLVAFSVFLHPAYARTFSNYESAVFLAKLTEVKVETDQIANHVGNQGAINYYQAILKTYWTPNDTRDLAERNPQLAQEISSDINATISDARAGSANKAGSDFFDIAGSLEQAAVLRVDPIPYHDATVQAMSIAMVVRESLQRYGDAVGSPGLGADTSNPGPVAAGGSQAGTVHIVNQYAYDNSKELANEGLQMFGQLITHSPHPAYDDKIAAAMGKYLADLGNSADAGTVLSDVYTGIYPNFASGYGISIQSVPEFPVPSAVILVLVSATILITRVWMKRP